MKEKKDLITWLEEKNTRKIGFFVVSMLLLFVGYFVARSFLV